MEYAVKIEHLTKEYRLYKSSFGRISDALFGSHKGNAFTALDDLSVELPKGEVIGILGKNGSGKSTLLKIITGVTKATSGTVTAQGRIAAMLELTSGFDPELTGIENIYLKALSMGIAKKDIEAKIDEIVAFADIGDHINQPIRTYSSGMKSRLGFAVSASVDPDILVVDEVLAVGDDIFRLKCIEKMKQFRNMGKTILFVSHSLFTVKAFCTMGMWINKGKLEAFGPLSDVVKLYEDFLKKEKSKLVEERRQAGDDSPLEKKDVISISKFRMQDSTGEKTDVFASGDSITVSFDYEVKRPFDNIYFCFTIRDAEKREIFMSPKQEVNNLVNSEVGKHHLEFVIKSPNLIDGSYMLSGELWEGSSTFYVGFANKVPFTIENDGYMGSGVAYFDYDISNK